MIDRIFLLSHPKFHNKNIIFIIETLLKNDYPLDFIFDNMYAQLKSFCYKQILEQIMTKILTIRKIFLGLRFHMIRTYRKNLKL